MKPNDMIKAACEAALSKRFPAGVPKAARERYDRELAYVAESGQASAFEFHRLLAEQAKAENAPFFVTGPAGGCYIFSLLGDSRIDPLPAHSYCPRCGSYEEADADTFGADMAARQCPSCGNAMRNSGFGLPLELMWDYARNEFQPCNYWVCARLLPYAEQALQDAYPESRIVPIGTRTELEDEHAPYELLGAAVLKPGRSMEDIPAARGVLRDGRPCFTEQARISSDIPGVEWTVVIVPSTELNELDALRTARPMGVAPWDGTVRVEELAKTYEAESLERALLSSMKPHTFIEAVNLYCSCHNQYSQYSQHTDRLLKVFSLSEFQKFPCYTREDAFRLLIENGIDGKTAARSVKHFMLGRKLADGTADTILERCYSYMGRECYLFPRLSGINSILLHAEIAYLCAD